MKHRGSRSIRDALALLFAVVAAAVFYGIGTRAMLPGLDDLRMYLIITDRFDDGDSSNDDANGKSDPRDPLAVQGGDLKGIERQLPYLEKLGVNAIWMTPVQMNVPGAFHGYWIQHFKRIDPRLGSMEDLRRTIRSAHARGIRVYLDVVCNHTAPLIRTKEGGYVWNDHGYSLVWKDSTQLPTPRALQNLALYHNYGAVKQWTDPYQVLGELPGGLSDLRTEDPRVLAIMIDIWTWWMEQTGCDGFRVDTVKHVDMPFWYAWLHAMRVHAQNIGRKDFFIFGEVFSNDDRKCAGYTVPDTDGRRGFDAVYNFSLADALRAVFGRHESVDRIAVSVRNFPLYDSSALSRQMIFIDNHDMSRFLAFADGDEAGMREALTFLYGLPGVPTLYYGTEQSFRGGTGPDWENRESMFAGGWKGAQPHVDAFDTTRPMFRHIETLNTQRGRSRILRDGNCTVADADTVRQLIVIRRSIGTREAFVIYNAGPEPADWMPPSEKRWEIWPEDAGYRSPDGRLHIDARRSMWLLPARRIMRGRQ